MKNTPSLNLKERRQAYSKVQAARAMQAKEIFLKELAAIGKQLEKQKDTAGIDFDERKSRKQSATRRAKDISKL